MSAIISGVKMRLGIRMADSGRERWVLARGAPTAVPSHITATSNKEVHVYVRDEAIRSRLDAIVKEFLEVSGPSLATRPNQTEIPRTRLLELGGECGEPFA